MPFPDTRALLAEWDGRIAAADPARQRARLATRAAASLGLALAVMGPLASLGSQKVTVVMLAGVVAMTSATSVKDGQRLAALATIGGAAVIALAVVSCAAALEPHPLAADIAFVAVMTGSTLLRRWGQRGFALGQLAFMTYFFALFLQAHTRQLPWMALAVLVGSAATAVVRCVLLPDRPAADLRRALRALGARVADVADEARLWLTSHHPDDRTRLLVRAGSRLGEVALIIERLLEQPSAARSVPDVDGLRGLVFDVEVAAEHLSDAIRHDGPALSDRARARFAARAGRLAFAARTGRQVQSSRSDALAATARDARRQHDDAPHLSQVFARLEESVAALSRVVVPRRLLDGYLPMAQTAGPAGGAPWPDTVRSAVQVAVAGALSMVAGKEISSARWFWAVLASYVVFINASTRTATLRRAVGRVVGTVGGVAAGLLLGKAIAGDTSLAVVVIIVLVFAAFWLVSVSYTGLVLCFTLTLAALYSILGTLSWSLMWLRIEETIAGALIGGAVALVLLPRRADDAVDADVDKVLRRAGDVLDRLLEGADPDDVHADVRRLDQAFQDLRTTIRPTIVGLPGPVPQRRRRQLLHVASVRYWTRTLTVVWQPGALDLSPMRSHLEEVRHALGRLRGPASARPAPGRRARGHSRTQPRRGARLSARRARGGLGRGACRAMIVDRSAAGRDREEPYGAARTEPSGPGISSLQSFSPFAPTGG